MKKLLAILTALCCITAARTQELNCRVQVISPTVQMTNKQIFTTLQNSLFQFLNNRRWTTENYLNNERIECSLLVEITEAISQEEFKAVLQWQSTRPVYYSDYKTPLFSHRDEDVVFKYREFEALEYQDGQNLSQLTSLMAYYVNVIIGLDADSYSAKGGTDYFTRARNIVNLNAGMPGWNRSDGKSNKNRFYLADNLLDDRFSVLRQAAYDYHLKGLDVMYGKPDDGRNQITTALSSLTDLVRILPNSMLIKVFFNAKTNELIEIYKGATPTEKVKIVELLGILDPANKNKYETIRTN